MLINRNLYKGANQDETRHMNDGLKRWHAGADGKSSSASLWKSTRAERVHTFQEVVFGQYLGEGTDVSSVHAENWVVRIVMTP